MRDRLRRYLRPPRGVDVRRVVAFVLLGVAIPRLPFYPLDPPVYPLHLLPGEVFGWLALATALALIVTTDKWRLHWQGRLVAALAFALWVTLAFATTSVTSVIIDITLACACFGEITATGRDNDC